MIKQILLVGLGGGLGSIFRFLTSLLTEKYYSGPFPLATFSANILGCLIIGVFIGFIDRNQITNPDLRFLIITGFCGGYTTFSAFSSENLTLLQAGNYMTSLLYVTASILSGIISVWLGLIITKL